MKPFIHELIVWNGIKSNRNKLKLIDVMNQANQSGISFIHQTTNQLKTFNCLVWFEWMPSIITNAGCY